MTSSSHTYPVSTHSRLTVFAGSLLLALATSSGCGSEEFATDDCGDKCDTLGIVPESTEVLFTFTAASADVLQTEINNFRGIFDAELTEIGFATETETSRGQRGGEPSLEFTSDLGLSLDGAPLSWSGYFQKGGALKKEVYENGATLLALDFGSSIYTLDGVEMGPNIDRFAVNAAGRNAVLSNWVGSKDGKTVATDERGNFLSGPVESARATARLAFDIAPDKTVRLLSGVDGDQFFRDFITKPAGSRTNFSDAIDSITRVNGQQGVTFLIEAQANADIGPIPVSVFRGLDPIAAHKAGGEKVAAEYLSLTHDNGTYTIHGVLGLDMVLGDYRVYVVLGEDHDDPESVYSFDIANGSPVTNDLQQLCSHYQCQP